MSPEKFLRSRALPECIRRLVSMEANRVPSAENRDLREVTYIYV
jgi:hypothetical protein